jgi:two-component system sensor histidine kinase KdpD
VAEHLPAVIADPGLLERVVANLVDNALRHGVDVNGRMAPAVAIRASTHADRVELRVVDHGKGLPKRAIESVFTPFQRFGDRDTSSGLGLGLSVARGFVDAMGGSIRAEDTPGGGLTMVVSLPAAVR